MKLYIRLVNGQPVDHPILDSNFQEAFPNIDVNNLPADYAHFERIQQPIIGPYQKIDEQPTYVWIDGVVKDNWVVTEMTAEEKAAKIALAMENNPFPSWIFNEENYYFEAPVAYPTEPYEFGYIWDEETVQWIQRVPE